MMHLRNSRRRGKEKEAEASSGVDLAHGSTGVIVHIDPTDPRSRKPMKPGTDMRKLFSGG